MEMEINTNMVEEKLKKKEEEIKKEDNYPRR